MILSAEAQSYHDEGFGIMSDQDMSDHMSDHHEAVVCENCYDYYDDSNYTRKYKAYEAIFVIFTGTMGPGGNSCDLRV